MKKEVLKEFFQKYIENTPYKAVVVDKKMLLCRLTAAVSRGIDIGYQKRRVYITTRCLKHLYDKKPAEEFLFLIKNLYEVVRRPEKIYQNRKGKRGEIGFVKRIGNFEYFCSIETMAIDISVGFTGLSEELQIATAFRLRDDAYIKKYTLLWDRGNGNPHRSALDAP